MQKPCVSSGKCLDGLRVRIMDSRLPSSSHCLLRSGWTSGLSLYLSLNDPLPVQCLSFRVGDHEEIASATDPIIEYKIETVWFCSVPRFVNNAAQCVGDLNMQGFPAYSSIQ